MSNAAENLHPPAMPDAPGLGLIKDSFEDTVPEEGGSKFPDYEFHLPEEKIAEREIGGIFDPVIVTDKQRTEAVLRALEQSCGEHHEEFRGIQTRDKRISRASSYLGQTVTIVEGKKRRREAVDQAAAMKEVREELAEVNHPVEQILRQIEDDFKGKLTPDQIAKLAHNVLTVTQWKRLHAVYDRQVEARRQKHPPKP